MYEFIRSNDKLGSVTLVYSNKVLMEKPGFRGVSHLTEHLKMRWILDRNAEYDRYGLNYNASTGQTEVIFFLSGLSRYLKKFVPEFLDNVLHYIPTRDEFERERKTVIAEYGEALTDQMSVYAVNFLRRHYDFCGSLGLRSDLEKLRYEEFLDFRARIYGNPDRMIEISGAAHSPEIAFGEPGKSRSFQFGDYPELPLETENHFEGKSIAHLHLQLEPEEYPYARFASLLLGGIGPLFRELRQKRSLTYGVSASAGKLSRESSTFDILALVDPKNLNTARDLAREVLLHPEKHLTRKRFDDELFACRVRCEMRNLHRAMDVDRYLTPENEQMTYLIEHGMLDYGMILDLIRSFGDRAMNFSDSEF